MDSFFFFFFFYKWESAITQYTQAYFSHRLTIGVIAFDPVGPRHVTFLARSLLWPGLCIDNNVD